MMGLLFKNDLFDQFGTWPLGYIPYGGADFGEIQAIAQAVGDGDETAFYNAFTTSACRFVVDAHEQLSKGKNDLAVEAFLKASELYSASWHPLYGKPVDSRIVSAFENMTRCFNKAMALRTPAVRPFHIPFESTNLPAYFIPATTHPRSVRPLLVLTNGYDGTITDLYFATAVAAGRRGYHCLLFDGPGQGEMLVKQGIAIRPDWEKVVNAAIDAIEFHPLVDKKRIAITGWSFGGYLAARAASGEPRLAACIADPGQPSLAEGFRQALIHQLHADPAAVTDLGKIPEHLLDAFSQAIATNRKLTWTIIQRGFWVNGVDSLREYLSSCERFTMSGREQLITCPVLVTAAENDSLSSGAKAFYDKLTCEKQFLAFPASRGAGDHCEMMNRALLNRKVFDWLDLIL